MRWLGSVASEPFCLQVLFTLKQKCVSIFFPDALWEEPRSLAVRTSPGIYLQGLRELHVQTHSLIHLASVVSL